MNITVIHPSRNRPQQAFETFTKWHDNSDNDFNYILSLDEDDNDLANYLGLFNPCLIGLSLGYNKSAIEAINGAAQFASGDIFIVISDDTDCFKGWDTSLIIMLHGHNDFVAKVDDGIQPTLVTMPIVHRDFYERYGYIYHPDYKHMGCDVELTAVAMMTGKYIKLPLTFNHLHYSTGKSTKDAINEKNDLTYQHGDEVLKEHLKNNFGIENPVMQYNEIVWH